MAASTFRVEAPYVTVKMTDGPTGVSVMGFYQGALVDGEKADKESVKRLVKRGMLKRLSAAAAAEATSAEESPDRSRAAKKSAPAKKSASSAPADGGSKQGDGDDSSSAGDSGKS